MAELLSTLQQRWARLRAFLREGLWEVELQRSSRVSGLHILQIGAMVVEGFRRDHLLLRASALTYFTVLSLVPLLAVGVSIVSGVGVGTTTFVDWVVGAVAAGSPDAQKYIDPLVRNVDFRSLGAVGGGMLFVTTVLAIGNIESTLNHIWGVARGRGWARSFADYLAVLVTGPLLGGAALSLTATLRSRWAVERLAELPGFALIHQIGLMVAPSLLLALAFGFLYRFLPNTRVQLSSAALGGLVAGVLVAIAQNVYVGFSVGAARADAFFGSFALLPLLFFWMYLFWAIVLLGAEVAYAHQHLALYREEMHGQDVGFAEREAIALRIGLEVARRFHAGAPAPEANELAVELRVPVRVVRRVAAPLLDAGILAMRVRAESDEGFQLGRPAETITVSDVLRVLRGGRKRHADDPVGRHVEEVLAELESAQQKAAGERTLAELIAELRGPRDVAASERQG